MIRKLISGGQTGADSCIVRVGNRLGIPIGGLVPKGWRTELGPMPALAKLGFSESSSADYRVRTRLNVERSDATLIFAIDPCSDGTRLTIDHAAAVEKPFLVANPFDPSAVELIRPWLRKIRPAVLNVAGNRESKAPGIAKQAEEILFRALHPEHGD